MRRTAGGQVIARARVTAASSPDETLGHGPSSVPLRPRQLISFACGRSSSGHDGDQARC